MYGTDILKLSWLDEKDKAGTLQFVAAKTFDTLSKECCAFCLANSISLGDSHFTKSSYFF